MFDDIWGVIVGIVAVLILVFGFAYVVESVSCEEKWAQSGFKSDFGLFKGCVIQLEDGVWIPAENYREIP